MDGFNVVRMGAKDILLREDARQMIARGAALFADTVQVTLGPRGRSVALEQAGAAPLLTKDGAAVAAALSFPDRFENLGAQIVKDAALRTSADAGDGTTTTGWITAVFSTDREDRVLLEDACVFLLGQKLTTLNHVLPMLEAAARERAPLLVIADAVEGAALATLVANARGGEVRACAVRAPGIGDERSAILLDLAALTGATVIQPDSGRDAAAVTAADLGCARRVEVERGKTLLVDGAGGRDSVAARAALEESVVPGGGVALLRAQQALRGLRVPIEGEQAGVDVVTRALDEPLKRIAANAGAEPLVVAAKVARSPGGFGYDAARGAYCDLHEAGVLDARKVVRLALQNAASVAALMLTTEGMVAEANAASRNMDADHA